MKEANHLAAVEIFEKVNASLLPQNVLDLHGLHVDEAIAHLMAVLQQKTEGGAMKMTGFQYEMSLCFYISINYKFRRVWMCRLRRSVLH